MTTTASRAEAITSRLLAVAGLNWIRDFVYAHRCRREMDEKKRGKHAKIYSNATICIYTAFARAHLSHQPARTTCSLHYVDHKQVNWIGRQLPRHLSLSVKTSS